MTYYYRNIKPIFSLLIISFFITYRAFSDTTNEPVNADSLEVFILCDSAMNNLSNYEVSLNFVSKANQIANHSGCESCIAESEFALGVVFYQNSLYDSSLYHFDRALSIYSKNNDSTRIVETIEYISYAYIGIFEFNESIKYARIGLNYADSAGLIGTKANFYLSMGSCYDELGLYKKSVDAHMNALTLFEAEKDSSGISSALINLGLIFVNNGNYTDALEYTSRALEICTKLNEKYGISVCLNNIGNIYGSVSEHKKALEYFKRSHEIDKELGDIQGIAISLNNIGDSYRDLKDTVLAISYYLKSLEIGKPHNYPIVSVALYNLGEVYLAQGNLNPALNYALESLDIAESTGIVNEILASYDLLHRIYSAMGSFQSAYNYLVRYKHLYDSTYTITKGKHILEVKAKYDDEKQKSEITSLKEKSTSETVRRTYLIRIIIVISSLIIVMLIINIFIRRSRRLVREQKLYYEKLLERSEGFIYVIDKNGNAKYISPAYERKIGRDIKNRIGKSAFEFIHPDDVESVKQEFTKLIADKQPSGTEFRTKNAFDEWIYLYAYGQNQLDDKLIKGIVVNFWDITQRKRDEEIISKNELKFRQIFNAFPDIYFQADINGVITEISPSVTKITGYAPDEILGVSSKKYHVFIRNWKRIGAEFETKFSIHDYDTEVITKDGSIIHCSLSAELVYSEDINVPIGIKGVLHDITNRIKNQQSLRESETKLKEANSSKEKLFSIIAHDLIGPIGTNKSIVDLIVSQLDELSYEEVISLITSLKPSLDSTYSLIENLLSWARIQQDRLKPNPENISLNKLVKEMVALLHGQAQRKSIELTVTEDKAITVLADKNQLDIALRNLVSNAIKFSNIGGEVSISLNSTDYLAEVKISDSGIGMTQKQINNILAGKGNPDVRRGTDNEKGTGFGLLIVNEFIKNNNGTLNVYSNKSGGTTFVISLPL